MFSGIYSNFYVQLFQTSIFFLFFIFFLNFKGQVYFNILLVKMYNSSTLLAKKNSIKSYINSSQVRRNEMNMIKHSFLLIHLKSQIFTPLKLGGMGKNEIRFNEYFTKTPKIPLYI